MASYEARSHAGAAIATTLASDITAVSTTLSLTAATGWPSGANGPFSLVINRGNATEEKIDCSSLSGTTVTVNGGAAGRGFDSTSAAIHVAGESIILTFTARDHQEANRAVNKTVGQATAIGQVLVADAANSLAAVQGKTSGQLLMGNGTTVVSQAVTGDVTINGSGVTAIGSSKVTSAMIVDGTIATGDIASGAITSALIADGTIATADIANLAITTALLNDSSVTSAKIVDATIVAADIAAATITQALMASGLRVPVVCTSSTRPGSPTAGDHIYETDTLTSLIYNGSAWVTITPKSAVVLTSETTASTTYTALATPGPVVSIQTGTKALVTVTCQINPASAGTSGYMSFAVSGATTAAASDTNALILASTGNGFPTGASWTQQFTGLTAGINTFTAQYHAQPSGGSNPNFANRHMVVVGQP